MAQVTTGNVYSCHTHSQEGHELAGDHPIVIIGEQSLIDKQGIAIVAPLTRTPPNYPVHWATKIKQTGSYAYIRHIKSISTAKTNRILGAATKDEMGSIRDGLAQELMYDHHQPAATQEREVIPGQIWSARIPNLHGNLYEANLLVLTSNHDTGMVTALTITPEHRGHPRRSLPLTLQEPEESGYAITYQVRSMSVEERFDACRGEITQQHLNLAKSYLLRFIEY